jgi:hypothetical protein
MTDYPHMPLGETFEKKINRVLAANKRAMKDLLERIRKHAKQS